MNWSLHMRKAFSWRGSNELGTYVSKADADFPIIRTYKTLLLFAY